MSSPTVPQRRSRANLGRLDSMLVSILLRTFRAWVVSTAVGAEVAIAALRGTPIAVTAVPLSAGFAGSAIGFNTLFLFPRAVTVSCPVILEVAGLEVTEEANIGKFNVLDFSGVPPYGLIEVDDLGM